MKCKKTGTPTGKIINTRKVKAVSSKCNECYHFQKKRLNKVTLTYCKYYDIFSPDKEKCVRFYKCNY